MGLIIVVTVVPLVIAVRVRLFGDVGGKAALRELLFELLADPRLLVWICNLLIRQVTLAVVAIEDPRRSEGDIPRGHSANIEVLVVPLLRWGKDCPLLPRDDRLLASWRP